MLKDEGKQSSQFLKRRSMRPQHRPSLRSRVDTLIGILSSEPKTRSRDQIAQLVGFMKAITFFSELVSTVDEEALIQCCQYMTTEFVPEGEFVFHAEDSGDKFYVVLSGSVAILKPESRVDGRRTFQQLALLREGGSFGELALISHNPRAASVLCREPTYLGVLGRHDYLHILGKAQETLLAKKVDLLHRNPVFSRWTKYSLQKFSYFFKEAKHTRKQVLFRAGEEPKEVFVVKSGEFQLNLNINLLVRKTARKEVEKTKCQAEVTLVGIGELMGAYEAVREVPHRYTCICHSTEGEVLVISRDDFLKRMSSEDAVTSLIALSEMVEGQRDVRIQTIFQREKEKRDINRLIYAQSLRVAAPSGVSSPILSAKKELEAEVRDRWFRDKAMMKEVKNEPNWTWARSDPASPRVASPVERGERPRHGRSWSDLMKMKFSKRTERSSDVSPTRPIVNIHTHRLKSCETSRYLRLQQALSKGLLLSSVKAETYS